MILITLCEYLKRKIDFDAFFTRLDAICEDTDLNERTNRADKGLLIELSLVLSSNGLLTHDNEKGYDISFRYDTEKVKIEVKSGCQQGFIRTRTGQKKTGSCPKTSTIQLMNTMGTSVERTLHNTFDFLLLIDRYSVGAVEHHIVEEYAKFTSDQMVAKIPLHHIMIIAERDKVSPSTLMEKYSTIKKKFMIDYLTI